MGVQEMMGDSVQRMIHAVGRNFDSSNCIVVDFIIKSVIFFWKKSLESKELRKMNISTI